MPLKKRAQNEETMDVSDEDDSNDEEELEEYNEVVYDSSWNKTENVNKNYFDAKIFLFHLFRKYKWISRDGIQSTVTLVVYDNC